MDSITYSAAEKTEINQWLTTSERFKASDGTDLILDTLNTHLASRTTLLGSKPSSADIAIYNALSPVVAKWTPEQRSGENGYPHIVRHLDFVQNSPQFDLKVRDEDRIKVDHEDVRYVKPPIDPKVEKERLKKEKALTAASTGNTVLADRTKGKPADKAADTKPASADTPAKEKKEKGAKQPKTPAAASAPATLSPSLIDFRVGHILKAVNHPDADSLYVSTIAVGDQPSDDTVMHEGQVCRVVCSGLNGLVPLEEMQGRKVVVVCNLKPVKMRGIKSCAMVLAASPPIAAGEVDDHKGPVELVSPPPGAKAGDRLNFQGWAGEPQVQLNPKKKIWETLQPGFTTTDNLEVVFNAKAVGQLDSKEIGKLVTEKGDACTVKTLRGSVVR